MQNLKKQKNTHCGFNRPVRAKAPIGMLVAIVSLAAIAMFFPYENMKRGGLEAQENALRALEAVVVHYTRAEFCGDVNWTVERGYKVTRAHFLHQGLVTPQQFKRLRLKAIDQTEAALRNQSASKFAAWCGRAEDQAVQFFLGILSADGRSVDTTMRF